MESIPSLTTSSSSNTPFNLQDRLLSQLQTALSLLPDSEFYLHAPPVLIQAESNPLHLLARCQGNVLQAASRLVQYWKERHVVFGAHRAYRPLDDLSGQGALTAEAVSFVSRGSIAVVHQRNHVTYVSTDDSRDVQPTLSLKLQQVFYMGHRVLQDNPTGQIIVISRQCGENMSVLTQRAISNLMQNVLQLELQALHLVYVRSDLTKSSWLVSLWSWLAPYLLETLVPYLTSRMVVHQVETQSKVADKLAQHGVVDIPLWGSPTFDRDFADYLERRSPSTGLHDHVLSLQGVDTTAYLQAHQHEITQSLTPAFMAWAHQNVTRAAIRLVAYCQLRQSWFAQSPWKPLDQTGDGALERKDVTALQSGYWTQLPHDAQGRPVLFCDGRKCCKASPQSQQRIAFYMWSVVMETPSAWTEGITLLHLVTDPSFDRANKECLDALLPVFPVNILRIHVLGVVPEGLSAHEYRQGPVQDCVSIFSPSYEMVVHVCHTHTEMQSRLSGYGLETLPTALGGSWGFEEFAQWQELRARHEWNLSMASDVRRIAASYGMRQESGRPMTPASDDKEERKRRMNVIHSRRKRERERIEIEGLQDQCEALQEDRGRLRKEQKRLTSLLEEAKEAVAN